MMMKRVWLEHGTGWCRASDGFNQGNQGKNPVVLQSEYLTVHRGLLATGSRWVTTELVRRIYERVTGYMDPASAYLLIFELLAAKLLKPKDYNVDVWEVMPAVAADIDVSKSEQTFEVAQATGLTSYVDRDGVTWGIAL